MNFIVDYFNCLVHPFIVLLLFSKEWQPRRTIILAFWDAHEYGAIGSTEFLEVCDLLLFIT